MTDLLRSRARGCLAGLAIGDALGGPTEGKSREAIARQWGRVTGFLSEMQTGSDDTEHALFNSRLLLKHGPAEMKRPPMYSETITLSPLQRQSLAKQIDNAKSRGCGLVPKKSDGTPASGVRPMTTVSQIIDFVSAHPQYNNGLAEVPLQTEKPPITPQAETPTVTAPPIPRVKTQQKPLRKTYDNKQDGWRFAIKEHEKRDRDLSGNALKVYYYILFREYMGDERKHSWTWPEIRTIAEENNLSTRTVQDCINESQAFGWLIRKSRPYKKGKPRSKWIKLWIRPKKPSRISRTKSAKKRHSSS